MSKTIKQWLTPKEAADFVGVTAASIRLYIAAGIIPAMKIRGTRWMIRREDLDAVDWQQCAGAWSRVYRGDR